MSRPLSIQTVEIHDPALADHQADCKSSCYRCHGKQEVWVSGGDRVSRWHYQAECPERRKRRAGY